MHCLGQCIVSKFKWMSLNIPCVLSWVFCNNAVLCVKMTPTMLVPRLGVSCVTVWHIVHIVTTTDNRFPHLTTSHPSQTTQHRAELQCGAAAGCYWLLGWFAVFRVSTVQSVNTGSLHCTALYCTVHMCSVHHTANTYTGHQPPFPYTAGFKLKISVNGHKLNYNSDTEGWL